MFEKYKDKKSKSGFSVRSLLFVAFISLVVGLGLSISLDFTEKTDAQEFWKESAKKTGKVKKAEREKILRPVSFAVLAKKLSPAVVNISTTQLVKSGPFMGFEDFRSPFEDFFGDDFNKFFDNDKESGRKFKRQSLGSGFTINKEGYILTNYHVIENATEIIVKFPGDKKEHAAAVIGKDAMLDIALVKIETDDDLPVVLLGDSDTLEIGEWVMAIGNPFGLGGTVTAGIVSQKGRVIGAGPYDNFIQTDASINPGNSGGPLFNMKGEVVAVNTAIIAGGQGIGFAIPVNMIKQVLQQLKDEGKVTRGWIGVTIQEVTPELAETFGLKEAAGVLISAVAEGDPADLAGLKSGDIIVEFNGDAIKDMSDLPRIVAAVAPDTFVDLKIIRDGESKKFSLKVGKKPGIESGEEAEEKDEEKNLSGKVIGLRVQELTPEVKRRNRIEDTEGVLVYSVESGGLGDDAGIKRGDIIIEVAREPVTGVESFDEAMRAASGKRLLLFRIKRGENTLYIPVKLPE